MKKVSGTSSHWRSGDLKSSADPLVVGFCTDRHTILSSYTSVVYNRLVASNIQHPPVLPTVLSESHPPYWICNATLSLAHTSPFARMITSGTLRLPEYL
ncbi:hypothetical protein CGMCC3_g4663 [Colletotrichum fructicola]|nr:uncharacterized protein CGMCC3_g4663 [Colletotrichum fructicola]KAE9579104.1 hypothetical protein CGMCC3_g4663 [Colletotrichum fructicola]